MKKPLLLLLIMVSPLALGGCAGALVGAGATAGVAVAQEGGIKRAWTDAGIQAEINKLWFEYDVDTFAKLDLTVNQGRVLITGVVQNPEARVEAVRLAWQPKGVKQVINEIRVAKGGGVTGYARDTWITTRLRSLITFDRNIQSVNYSIDTVQGTVYLMGSAQNQQELNRVIEKARTIPDVKQVVSYVKLLGRPVLDDNFSPPQEQQQRGEPVESLGAETWRDETPARDTSGGYNAYGNEGPVTLVPEPVQTEQLN